MSRAVLLPAMGLNRRMVVDRGVSNAAALGYATGSTPSIGAIAEIPGHVMYVEAINGDGTIVISEMNGPAGFGVVGTRTISESSARYIY
jgi:surface antigen